MKKIGPALVIILLIFASCKKKGCTDTSATNYNQEAQKDDGSCIPDPRQPYLGTYSVIDSMNLLGSFNQTTTYSLNVTTGGTTGDTLLLGNLWGDGGSYYCLLINESITIYSQQVNGPYYTSGNGNVANSAISYSTSGDEFEHWGSGTKD